MVKCLHGERSGALVLVSPGLQNAPVLDLMCSHFVLTLAARRGSNFNMRRGHEALDDTEFLARHGTWAGPDEEGTLVFYLDEYAKDQPKDLISLLAITGDWLNQSLKKRPTLVQKNIDALAGLLQLNKAERALLLYGTLARYQRDLRSLLVEFKVNNAPEAYAAIAEHNITDLADLMRK